MSIPPSDSGTAPPSALSSVPDTSREGLKRRLERISAIVGSVNALAKSSSIPQSTIRKYFIKGEAPSMAIIALAKATGVRPGWLLTGEGPVWVDVPTSEEKKLATDDVAFVPLYFARAKTAAGASFNDFAGLVNYLPFKRSWLRHHLDVAAEDLAAFYFDGDSMEPVLRSNDMILINTSDLDIREGVHAFIRGHEFLIKRLQIATSGQIKIVSENKSYKPLSVPVTEVGNQMKMVGRVVWVSRRMP